MNIKLIFFEVSYLSIAKYSYFKKSHRPKEFLESKISEKKIEGGGLKTYLDTRWTTVYEMLNSISRLELCLKEV